MGCAPVRRDNLRALARGLSTVQAHKPCSISLVPQYPVWTLHSTEYLLLKIGYLWNVVQWKDIQFSSLFALVYMHVTTRRIHI